MPKKRQKRTDPVAELLRDLLIVELSKAKVTQPEIRKIVGCDMARVNRIARFFKRKKSESTDKK